MTLNNPKLCKLICHILPLKAALSDSVCSVSPYIFSLRYLVFTVATQNIWHKYRDMKFCPYRAAQSETYQSMLT